jgi:hypothetical protein
MEIGLTATSLKVRQRDAEEQEYRKRGATDNLPEYDDIWLMVQLSL